MVIEAHDMVYMSFFFFFCKFRKASRSNQRTISWTVSSAELYS